VITALCLLFLIGAVALGEAGPIWRLHAEHH
jgi:hypothetical protein